MHRVLAGLALLVVAALAVCRIVEHDTPWYLASGELILRTHGLPRLDPFSYTSTRAWMNHEWLSEIVLALGHRAGGMATLSVVQGLAVATAIGALARRSLGAAPAWALLAFVLREVAAPRAQLFSTVLFAATLALVLEDWARPRARLWLCVPIQLLWTQLHGGNPTGVALLGLLFLAGPSRRRAVVTAACVLATVVGPYGLAVHAHFLDAHAALPMIREWQPLTRALAGGSPAHWTAVALWIGAGIALVLRARSREPVRLEVLAWLVFGAIAARYLRFATEASIVAAAILARALAERFSRRAAAPIALAALLGLCAIGERRLGLGLAPERFPVDAVAWLRAHAPPGPMLNAYNFGGYLLWAWPEQKVFVDGRAFTVYDESIVGALPALYAEPSRFTELERRFGFRLAVLQREGRGAGFLRWLSTQPGWERVYEDPLAVVLVRRAASEQVRDR